LVGSFVRSSVNVKAGHVQLERELDSLPACGMHSEQCMAGKHQTRYSCRQLNATNLVTQYATHEGNTT
jgi:hypothetical protein